MRNLLVRSYYGNWSILSVFDRIIRIAVYTEKHISLPQDANVISISQSLNYVKPELESWFIACREELVNKHRMLGN